jgi:hypothetical protein
MKNLKQFINEVGDKPVHYNWFIRNNDMWRAEFMVENPKATDFFDDENWYEMSIEYNKQKECWFADFALMNSSDQRGMRLDTTTTGTGNSIQVFSTVSAIMKEFLTKQKPECVKFDSAGKRGSIFLKMLKKVNGYFVEKDTSRGGRWTHIKLTKK